MSNSSAQSVPNEELAEEIEAVNAIYDPSTLTVTSNPDSPSTGSPINTTLVLRIPDHSHISFMVGFEADYPATPPIVFGTASTSSRGEGKKLVDILAGSVAKVWQPGFVCLYDVIVDAGEQFDAITEHAETSGEALGEHNDGNDDDGSTEISSALPDPAQVFHATFGLDRAPDWILSEPVTEKKSVFIARVAIVHSKDIAAKCIDHLLATEKKVATATHNITAWRIKQKAPTAANGGSSTDKDTLIQDFDDDGESAAGGRLLHLMQLMDVWDVVVVVTRWYGGVKLGPDRFRIINAVARDALLKAGFAKSEGGDANDKGKKKSKK